MYFGVDSISNSTKPHEQSGVDATLLAQVLSGISQPRSNLTRSDGCACHHLLGKRHSTLEHVNFDASHLKKQKLAMHVNTRHMNFMDLQYPPESAQDLVNKSFSYQDLQAGSTVGRKQSKSISDTNSIEDAAIFASKELDLSSCNAIGNTYIKNIMATNALFTNSLVFDQNSLIIPSHANTPSLSNTNAVIYISDGEISADSNVSSKVKSTSHKRGTAHPEFLGSVQRWTNAIKYVCDARKQQLDYELFGDEPTCTADPSELLKVLKHIDQKKNKISREEEHATGLIEAIFKVLGTCDNSTEKESIMLAGKILDNLLQRFHARRFNEVSG